MQLSSNIPWDQAQNRWASALNPLLANPLNLSNIITGVQLKTGVNVINHLLGRQMQGWFITDINAGVSVYRSGPMNNLTLTLTASGPATANIGVF